MDTTDAPEKEDPRKKKKAAHIDFENMDSMEQVIAALNKKYGANTVIVASRADGLDVRHISTGCYALDIALGGGIAKNRVTEIRGPFSSFKSTISLFIIARFQRANPEGWAVYIDLEKSFDRIYAKKLGVDLDRLLIVTADSGEQAVDVVASYFRTKFEILMILDSIAALIPTSEIVADAEQQSMGVQARLVNKLMRIATARLKRSMYDDEAPATTLVCLNQLRMKIGVVFGDPETSPGGMGKDFAYSAIIRLSASPSKVIDQEETRNGVTRYVRYGQEVSFKIKKNKTGGPQHEEGSFKFYEREFEGHRACTFDNEEALFNYGAFYGAITFDATRGYRYAIGNNPGEFIQSKRPSDFHKALRKYPRMKLRLYLALLDMVKPSLKSAKAILSSTSPLLKNGKMLEAK